MTQHNRNTTRLASIPLRRDGDDEPVYEYRVVCSDGMFGPMPARDYEHAESVAAAFTNAVEGAHYHTVERRAVGPWEAT